MLLTAGDFLLLFIQLPLCYILIGALSKKIDPELRSHFKNGIFLKLAACILLDIVYQYYYGAGDTLTYFAGSKIITNEMLHSPGSFFKYLFSSEDEFGIYFRSYVDQTTTGYSIYSTGNLTIMKIAALGNFISFNSLFGTGFVFCFFSYFGLWKLFMVFYKAYPDIGKKFVVILYIPSVVFWSSGILKDSFCLGCIGLAIYLTNSITSISLRSIFKSAVIVGCLYLVWLIKDYIFFCLIIPLLIWKYSFLLMKLRQYVSIKVLVIGSITLLLLIYKFGHIANRFQVVSLEELYLNILKTRAGFMGDDDGSSFSLGEFTPTVWGFIQQIPKAITAVLFRPYIWESRKIFSLMAAGESLLILVCTVFVLVKTGIVAAIKNVFRNPDIFFCFFFAILFALALGISVSNFGALVRFKIQFLPFFVIGLLLIYHRKEKRSVTTATDNLDKL